MEMACTASVAVSCCPACGWRAGGAGSSSSKSRSKLVLPAGNAGLRNPQLQGLALAAAPGRKAVARSGANGTGLVVEARRGSWFDLQQYEEQHGEVSLAEPEPGVVKGSSAAEQPVPVPGSQEALEGIVPETSDRVLSGVGKDAVTEHSGAQENVVPTVSGEDSSVLELERSDPEPDAKEEVSGDGAAEEKEEQAVAVGGLPSGDVAVAGGLSADAGQDEVVVSPGAATVEAAVGEVRISPEGGFGTDVLATGEEAVAGAEEEGNEDGGLVGEEEGSQEVAEAAVVGEAVPVADVTAEGKGLVEGDALPGEASVGDGALGWAVAAVVGTVGLEAGRLSGVGDEVEPEPGRVEEVAEAGKDVERQEAEDPLGVAAVAVEVAETVEEAAEPAAGEEPADVGEGVERQGQEDPLEVAAVAVDVEGTVEEPDAPAAEEEPVEASAADVQPVEASATDVQPVEASAAEEQPVEASAAEEQPVEASAAEEQPVEASAAEEQPVEASAAEEQPVEPSAAEEQPVEASAADVQPVEASAAEEQPVEASAADELEVPAGAVEIAEETVEPSQASAEEEPAPAEELETEEQEGALEASSAALEVAEGTIEPTQPSAGEEPEPANEFETKEEEGAPEVAAAAVEVVEGTAESLQPSAAEESAEPSAAEELVTQEEHALELEAVAGKVAEGAIEPTEPSAGEEPAPGEELQTEEEEDALVAAVAGKVAEGATETTQPSAGEKPAPQGEPETQEEEEAFEVAAVAGKVAEGAIASSQPSGQEEPAEPSSAEDLKIGEPEDSLELSAAAVEVAEGIVQATEPSSAEEPVAPEQESDEESEDTTEGTADQIQIVPTKVYVGGLPFTLQGKQLKSGLKRVFGKYGEVKGLQIVPFFSEGKAVKGRHRGFVFVIMDSAESAQAAIENLNGQVNLGRTLTVRQGVMKPASMKEAETPQPKKRQSQIFVANLCRTLSDEDLENAFKPFGTVTQTRVITDYVTGRSKGFGFVTFENEENAQAAIAALDGSQLGQTTVRVSFNKQPAAESS